jgi:hypothetical protein
MWNNTSAHLEKTYQMGRIYLPKLKYREMTSEFLPFVFVQLMHHFPNADFPAIWKNGIILKQETEGVLEEALIELSLVSDSVRHL